MGISVFDDISVEVHFHPAWLYNPIFNFRLQKFFNEEFKERSFDKQLGVYLMPIEFDAVLSLAHMFRHLLAEGIRFRHVIDFYFIVRRLRLCAIDVDRIGNVIKSVGLDKFCGALMWVLHEACGMPRALLLCETRSREGLFLLKELLSAGSFRYHKMKANSIRRYIIMGKHFPRHVMWMIPWKVWHRGWMAFNK